MSKIHHFQRYSSYENVVTNNTLQLISRIYGYSPFKAKLFLDDLLEEDLDVGISIYQQSKGKNSIPDGFITQQSFKIVIEAKVTAELYIDQLLRHVDSFANEEIKILLALTKEPLTETQKNKYAKAVLEKSPGVIFKSITYEDICQSLTQIFKNYEHEVFDILTDYIDYCHESGLIPQNQYLLRIVPTGSSYDLNKKYSTYYHPTYRGYTPHTYLGLYIWKSVRAVMKIESIFDVEFKNDKLEKIHISGENTDKFDEQIIGLIKESKDKMNWDVSEGHRFFCSSKIIDTDFVKESTGGIQGPRYENLNNYNINLSDIESIAKDLKSRKWK